MDGDTGGGVISQARRQAGGRLVQRQRAPMRQAVLWIGCGGTNLLDERGRRAAAPDRWELMCCVGTCAKNRSQDNIRLSYLFSLIRSTCQQFAYVAVLRLVTVDSNSMLMLLVHVTNSTVGSNICGVI